MAMMMMVVVLIVLVLVGGTKEEEEVTIVKWAGVFNILKGETRMRHFSSLLF